MNGDIRRTDRPAAADGDGAVHEAAVALRIVREDEMVTIRAPDPAAQTAEAKAFLAKVRAGAGLFLPWADLAGLVGLLLPGWFVAVGARLKGGKSTMLANLALNWVEMGRRVLYVGTEQPASQLRLVFAALLARVPVDAAIEGRLDAERAGRFAAELDRLERPPMTDRLLLGDAPDGFLSELEDWSTFAVQSRCDAMVFDHLHRLDTGDGESAWISFAGAVRRVKNLARDRGLLIIAAAQLKMGEGGALLGEHEAPGNSSWYGGLRIAQEADVALQLWRPFRTRISHAERTAAREQGTLSPTVRIKGKGGEVEREYTADPLVQPNVMAVRVAAHRYRDSARGEVRRLFVRDGWLESYERGASR